MRQRRLPADPRPAPSTLITLTLPHSMSGHSKWAKVKRAKAVTDSRRGKIFSRLAREITITAKAGGGDPGMNPRLRTILMKAREANMPADNIDRAIKKGTGELPGVVYEEVTYEGYAPGGVALVVQVTTDNKNRAASEVRSVFTRYGGNLAGAGAVLYKFHAPRPVSRRQGQGLRGHAHGDRPRCRRRRRHHHRARLRNPLRHQGLRRRHPRPGKKGHQARLRRDRLRAHPDPSRHQPRRRPLAA